MGSQVTIKPIEQQSEGRNYITYQIYSSIPCYQKRGGKVECQDFLCEYTHEYKEESSLEEPPRRAH